MTMALSAPKLPSFPAAVGTRTQTMPNRLTYVVVLLIALGGAHALRSGDDEDYQTVCNATSPNHLDYNPIGTCNCDGHLWISEDCTEGFYCLDTDGNGCYKVPRQF